MDYKIVGFKLVSPSQLEHLEIRSKKNENLESLEELKESITEFNTVSPLLVRANSHGKYQVLAGNRRLRAMKSVGIKEIPVNVVETGDSDLKLAALIDNVGGRLDMDTMDIAHVLLDLYRDNGFSNDKIMYGLYALSRGEPSKLTQELKRVISSVGIPPGTQLNYIKELMEVVPEARKIMRETSDKNKTHNQSYKSVNVLGKLKDDPKLQVATARIVKDLTIEQGKEFVDNVRTGKISHTGTSFQVRGKPLESSKDVEEYLGSPHIEGIELAGDLIKVLTHQSKSKTVKLEDTQKAKNYRLQAMKRMDESDLNRLYNYLSFLKEIIDDTLPTIERELETNREKDSLLKP